jgi:diguanylate cyclase (GGDEF)-like protein/PAS domain S-box-containing protein
LGVGAIIIWRSRIIPGILLGELLNSIIIYKVHQQFGWNEDTFYNALFLTLNVLRPLVAGYWVLSVLGNQMLLVNFKSVLKFFLFAAVIPMAVTSLLFIFLLNQIGYFTDENFFTKSLLFYIGDIMSVLIFTPIILTLFAQPRSLWRNRIISLTLPVLVSFILIYLLFNSFRQFQIDRINEGLQSQLNLIETQFNEGPRTLDQLLENLKKHSPVFDVKHYVTRLYQSKENQRELLYFNKDVRISRFKDYIHESQITIENTDYVLFIAPNNDLFLAHTPQSLWLTLLVGIFFAAFITFIMLILSGKNYTTKLIVTDRTKDLNKINKKLAQTNLDYKRIIESHPVIFWKVNIKEDRIKFVSTEAKSLLGYPIKQWLNEPHFLMNKIHPDDLSRFKEALFQKIFKHQNIIISYRIQHANGDYRWFKDTLYIPDDFDQTQEIMGMMVDINEEKSNAQKIQHLAFHDALTQLPNRQQLQQVLNELIRQGKSQQQFGAVLFLDMDRFKVLNDALGHHFGDQLLLKISNRLKLYQDEFNLIARFGGDEFVLVTNCEYQSANDAAVQVVMLAEDIIQTLAKPYQIDHHQHICTVSIGVSIYPNESNTVNDIIRQADVAMYRSKEQGRNQVTMYHQSMKQLNDQILYVEQLLRHAVNEDSFILKYQPMVNADRQIVSFEALIRIFEDGRTIYPDEFIPVAEDTDLIQALGRWVITNACYTASESGHNISINVSSKQFHQQGFIKYIEQIINQFNIKTNSLTIELTEGVVVGNFNEIQYKFNRLSDLGVQIAIDDFGTGYSSLQYLRQLPIDFLKIDKSFIDDVLTNDNAEVIIRTITSMAKNLNLKTVAEGVETEEQFQLLKELGCDFFQGYLFGRPGDLQTVQEPEIK